MTGGKYLQAYLGQYHWYLARTLRTADGSTTIPTQLWKGVQLHRWSKALMERVLASKGRIVVQDRNELQDLVTNVTWTGDVIDFGSTEVKVMVKGKLVPVDKETYDTWLKSVTTMMETRANNEELVASMDAFLDANAPQWRTGTDCYRYITGSLRTAFYDTFSLHANRGVDLASDVHILSPEEEARYTDWAARAAMLVAGIPGDYRGSIGYGGGSTQGILVDEHRKRHHFVYNDVGLKGLTEAWNRIIKDDRLSSMLSDRVELLLDQLVTHETFFGYRLHGMTDALPFSPFWGAASRNQRTSVGCTDWHHHHAIRANSYESQMQKTSTGYTQPTCTITP